MRPGDGEDRDLRERLAALRADPPEGDFSHLLRQRLVAAGPPEPPSAWARLREVLQGRPVLWPALGAAAGVAVVLLLSPGAIRGGPVEPPPSAVVHLTQVAVVRLNLAAEVPVDGARIRVTLPPGLSFWSEGQLLAQRDFEWTQPLSTGDNEIPIAVRGERPGRYRIAVDAQVGGQRVEDAVFIEVRGG